MLSGAILSETYGLTRQLKEKTLLEVMRYTYPPEQRRVHERPEVAQHEAQEGLREVHREVAEEAPDGQRELRMEVSGACGSR